MTIIRNARIYSISLVRADQVLWPECVITLVKETDDLE